MGSLDGATFINLALSFLLKKIVVPSDYHHQVQAVKEMQMDDISGLVDSLTDFSVESATVDFTIETDNSKFTKTLKKWMERVNKDYPQIPSGMQELSKEYFKERWKYSSFPILKIAEWGTIDGITVPTKMFFVDGESIVAHDIDENDENLKVTNYDYYIGSKKESKYKLEKNCIYARPFGRWFDEYPVPYLIKRGVYHNWKIIQSLKSLQSKILEQVIPYMLLVKKGSEGLAKENIKTYSQPELQQVVTDMQALMDEMKSTNSGGYNIKSPIRATNFDEEITHLIPKLDTIFDPKLFAQAERNVLSGLGFIDVIQGISDTRKESILNPKGFVVEIKSGVDGFKGILKELVFLIQEKNKKHIKYMNSEFYVSASPVNAFMSDSFKELIRSLYDRGRVSSQTAVELIAETDFRTEVHRREKEEKQGISERLYPPVIRNDEGKGIDLPGDTPEDEMQDHLPEDKKGIEKKNYDMSKTDLEGSPYPTLVSLPDYIKKKYNKTLQNKWRKIWNNAYQYMLKKTGNIKRAESYAFRVANAQMRVKSKKKSKKKKL